MSCIDWLLAMDPFQRPADLEHDRTMSEAIYLLQEGGALIAMQSEPYESEGLLQELLTKHPHLLAAVQLLEEARELERQALEQDPPSTDLLEEAIELKEEARVEMLVE